MIGKFKHKNISFVILKQTNIVIIVDILEDSIFGLSINDVRVGIQKTSYPDFL